MASRSADEVFAGIPDRVAWKLAEIIPERFPSDWPPRVPINLEPGSYDEDVAAIFSTHSIFKNVSSWYKPQNILEFAGDRLISSAIGCMMLRQWGDGLEGGGCDWLHTRLVSRKLLSLLGVAYDFQHRLLHGRRHPPDEMVYNPTQADIEDAFEALVAVVYKRRGFEVMREWLETLMAPFLAEALRAVPEHHKLRQLRDLEPKVATCVSQTRQDCISLRAGERGSHDTHLPVVLLGRKAPPLPGEGKVYVARHVDTSPPAGLKGVRERIARDIKQAARSVLKRPSADLLPQPPAQTAIAKRKFEQTELVDEFGRRSKKSSSGSTISYDSVGSHSTTSSSVSSGYMRAFSSRLE